MAIDDNTLYGLTGAQIKDLPEEINKAKGQSITLTPADYNYPVNNPDGVAMWKVPSGVYTNTNGTKVYLATGSVTSTPVSMVVAHQDNGNTSIMYSETRGLSGDYPLAGKIVSASGGEVQVVRPIDTGKISNSLTVTSNGYVLDARQGKTLNDRIGDLSTLTTTDKTSAVAAINEIAAGSGGGITELTTADYNYPTNNPNGVALWLLEPGMYIQPSSAVYVYANNEGFLSSSVAGSFIVGNTKDGKKKILAFGAASDSTALLYSTAVSDGAKDYVRHLIDENRIVQTTGTATDYVMSQNAVTKMVYADPAAKRNVQIGVSANAQNGIGLVATGEASHAYASGEAALASYAGPSGPTDAVQGVAYLNARNSAFGYNNSNYRLLTGLYDPQNAHDAATKGYVDAHAGGPTVVQTTGASTTDVMSQNAVTTELASKAGTAVATTSANGLMSSTDKSKLNSLDNMFMGTGIANDPYAVKVYNSDQNSDTRYSYVRTTGYSSVTGVYVGGIAIEPDATWYAEARLALYSDLPNMSNYVSTTDLSTALADYTTTANLSTVATSGSYNDLSDKPTIPTVNNATLTIQKNGTTVKTFTANASSNVTANITVPTKTSELTNDSGYTTNTGTITKVQANGTDVASSGTANIPAASTSAYGVTKLSSSTSSTSTALAATPSAVKSAYDLANGKATITMQTTDPGEGATLAANNFIAVYTA